MVGDVGVKGGQKGIWLHDIPVHNFLGVVRGNPIPPLVLSRVVLPHP